MDYNKLEKICELYDQELNMLDDFDINDEKRSLQLQKCHEEYCELLGNQPLAIVYEKVRGLINPTTIELYFEEAEKFEDDYEKMVSIYKHVLEGCRLLYGETGEKTIECQLQIAVCIRNLCEQRENEQCALQNSSDDGYSYKTVLQILENLFLQNHQHPLYGTFISIMLCDEYVREGNKGRALETFEKWSRIHPVQNIADIEEVNAWIEYSALLAELGFLTTAINNAEIICKWMEKNLSEYDHSIPYIVRRISEIYVSCSFYEKAIEILKNVNEHEDDYSTECKEEFLNIKAQLAHCYNLNGNRIEAVITGLEVENRLKETGIQHPSKNQFDNILSNIIGGFGDHFEQYDKLFHAYVESKRRLGENNEETLLYEMNLGSACLQIYYEVNDDEKEKYINEADDYLTDAYEHSEKGRGKGNLLSFLIKQKLAEVKAEKGEIFHAIAMLEEVWHKNAEILSEDNPETADAKLRYAALCLEVQQKLDEIPEWLEKVDPEPILEECFLTKKKFLGIRHWETIDALYWYVRAAQSNELIDILQNNAAEQPFEKSLELHRLLFHNIVNILEQAFYINSVEKQNEYMDILESEFFQIFWLLTVCVELEIQIDLEEIYEMIAAYKNLSYDMQYYKLVETDDKMRKKFAESLSTDGEVVEYLYRNKKFSFDKEEEKSIVKQISQLFFNTNEVFIDLWQEANTWNVFLIDKNGITYRNIDFLKEDEIPDIEDDEIEKQPQLDGMKYTFEERLEWSLFLVEQLTEDLNGYSKIYLNLHKQVNQFPIQAFVYKLTGIPSVVVSSVNQILNLKDVNTIWEARIGFLEDEVSIDQQIVKSVFQNANGTREISEAYNIISVSGHGFYDAEAKEPEGRQNYIAVGENHRIYIQDIISENLKNVELAFLPVCQSGSGKNYQIFGDYSLGKAFRMAGVGYTIETLWDIPLSASLVFEYEFFQRLKETGLICDAFYDAVQRLINYTSDELKQFCKLLLKVSGNRQLVRILFSEISNGLYPFKEVVYWAGFCLQKGEK